MLFICWWLNNVSLTWLEIINQEIIMSGLTAQTVRQHCLRICVELNVPDWTPDRPSSFFSTFHLVLYWSALLLCLLFHCTNPRSMKTDRVQIQFGKLKLSFHRGFLVGSLLDHPHSEKGSPSLPLTITSSLITTSFPNIYRSFLSYVFWAPCAWLKNQLSCAFCPLNLTLRYFLSLQLTIITFYYWFHTSDLSNQNKTQHRFVVCTLLLPQNHFIGNINFNYLIFIKQLKVMFPMKFG